MQTMFAIIAVVAPVFGIIALGYGASRIGLVRENVARIISRFVFDIAIPAFLFRTMVSAEAPEASPWVLWACYFGGAVVSGTIAAVTVRRLLKRPGADAIIAALAGAYSNTVLLGIPLVISFFGESAAAVPLFIIISVHLPLMTLAGTLMVEWTSASGNARIGTVLAQTLKSIATNPIVIGLAAGIVWRFTGLGLNAHVDTGLGWLSAVAVPAALFAMGLALNRFGFTGDLPATGVILACKLFVHPLAVWLLAAHVFTLPDVWVAVAVIFAAAPSGINVFLFASRYDVAVPAASAAIALGTAIAAGSITVITWVLGLHGG